MSIQRGDVLLRKTVAIERTRAVLIVVNRAFPVVELIATRDIVAVKLDTDEKQIVMTSLYLPPGVDTHMSLLQELIQNDGIDIIILGDLNAKSLVWGNPLHKTDVRGDDLLQFCVQNNLMIIKDASSEATFQSSRGDNLIDLALSQLTTSTTLSSWKVEQTEAATHHRRIALVISMDIPSSGPSSSGPNPNIGLGTNT